MKGEAPRTRRRRRRGVDSGEGCLHSQSTTESWKRSELPRSIRWRAATENEFGHSIAVRIMLVAIIASGKYVDDSEVHVLH